MAYAPKNLSALSYANSFTLWHYKTEDLDLGPNYFGPASAMLRVGDVIIINLTKVLDRNASARSPDDPAFPFVGTAFATVTRSEDGVVNIKNVD